MGGLDIVAIASVFAGFAALYALIFGSRPLLDMIRKGLQARRQKKMRPRTQQEEGQTQEATNPAASGQTSLDAGESILGPSQIVDRMKALMDSSAYRQAVALGKRALDDLAELGRSDNPEFQLTVAELSVWYGLALIYTGKTADGLLALDQVITGLERRHDCETVSFGNWRWNLVLGRAHNHIGYTNWMALGHYESALKELREAIRHLAADSCTGKCKHELATAYDNMGRVYAQLGYRTRAELLIEHGRRVRLDLNDEYRYALSLNSRAIAHLTFGEPDRALALGKEALEIFSRQQSVHGERGIGLALITMGQALRYLGACWQYSSVAVAPYYRKYLDDAISTLKTAVGIFDGKVHEPLRLYQAYNELGCAYRERALLGRGDDPESARQAEGCLKRSADLVRCDYPVLYVDACEDLAQTYFFGGDYRNAEKWIGLADGSIPDAYKLRKGTQAVCPTECVVDFWQQLGKVFMLRGHMRLDQATQHSKSPRQNSLQPLDEAIECYTLACAYFGCFLDHPRTLTLNPADKGLYPYARPQLANHRLFIEQLYARLSRLAIEDLDHIYRQSLPSLRSAYALKEHWLDEFYGDVLGLLLQTELPSGEQPE